jgi:hypothetical protein
MNRLATDHHRTVLVEASFQQLVFELGQAIQQLHPTLAILGGQTL